jgi:hypothetical protein
MSGLGGHHLILGRLVDAITGESLDDTHDERYRQALARFLLETKAYRKEDIAVRRQVTVAAGDRKARVPVDFLARLEGRTGMLVRYGPGSLVTRHRPTLALARLVEPYQVPVVVVTNGRDADVLHGGSGATAGSGMGSIPSREELAAVVRDFGFPPVSAERAEREARIVYAYEVDDACPCDDTACRL